MGTSTGERTPLGDPVAFEGGLTEIAPGTWAWIQPNGGLGESNAGLIVGDGEALLIDTLWDERLTTVMLAAMGPMAADSGARITQLFNTHGDGDHWYGNGLLDPDVDIHATELAIEGMRSEPPSVLTRMAPLGSIAGRMGRFSILPGSARMRGLAAFNSALDAYEFRGIGPRIANKPFSERVELDAGGRTVELIPVGPAHTMGDAIAWLEDTRTVFAGDIQFSGVTPIMWAGPVGNWIKALDLIEDLGPEVVIGGHGPIGGVAEIAALRDYWSWLLGEVRYAGAYLDPMRLAEHLVGSAEFEPWAGWDGVERILVNISRIAATEAGGSSEIGVVERIRLISDMGVLAERLRG